MRTRSRTDIDYYGSSVPYEVWNENGIMVGNYPQVAPRGGRNEVIIDEEPRFTSVGAVSHVYEKMDDLSSLDDVRHIVGVAGYYGPGGIPIYFANVTTRAKLLLAAHTLAQPPPAMSFEPDQSLVGLAAKASDRISKLTLLNTIWETKDFPGMFEYANRQRRLGDFLTGHRQTNSPLWRKLFRLADNVRPLKGARRILQFGRLLRDEGLGWAFGWEPTLQDMRNISRELPRAWKKRGEDLKPFTVRSKSDILPVTYNWGVPVNFNATDVTSGYKVAGVRCVPPEPNRYYFDRMKRFDKLIHELVGNPLTVIWEMVPWSFAIDWFLSVDNLIADAGLRSSGWSIQPWQSQLKRCTRTWKYEIATSVVVQNGTLVKTPISWVHSRSMYHRTPAQLPGLLTNIRFRAGPKQAILGILLGLGLLDRSLIKNGHVRG